MIKNFDTETAALNDYEQTILLPIFLRSLRLKVGRQNAVTSAHIIERLKAKYLTMQLTGARVRKIVNYIRNHDLVCGLIATDKGYYIAESEQEMDEYVESLRGREDAIRAVRESMERQRRKMFAQNPQQTELQFN